MTGTTRRLPGALSRSKPIGPHQIDDWVVTDKMLLKCFKDTPIHGNLSELNVEASFNVAATALHKLYGLRYGKVVGQVSSNPNEAR